MTPFFDWILLHAGHSHFPVGAPFLVGLIASLLHVISGPDHLAAVTPLAIDNRLKAWIVGLGWGFGHVFGMLLIGLLFLLFRNLIPVDLISEYSEVLVGIILIAIGLWALWRVFGHPHPVHSHPHSHTDEIGQSFTHIHHHNHPSVNIHRHDHLMPVKQSFFSALFIGTIHGLAGVSHLIGMLPTLAFPTMGESVFYLSGFALGTIVAMVAFSFILGFVAFKSEGAQSPRLFRSIRITGAFVSLIVGVFWIFQSF
ncbi:hypothetical protein MASR2M12_05460 [Bacteroidales bacterium]